MLKLEDNEVFDREEFDDAAFFQNLKRIEILSAKNKELKIGSLISPQLESVN